MSTKIRVVLADDHDLFRSGLRAILTTVAGMEVVGEASTGSDARAVVAKLQPDVLLLDVEMGGPPTRSILEWMRIEAPYTRTIIITMHRDRILAAQLTRSGAAAFLSKSASLPELVSVVRGVAQRRSSARTRNGVKSGTQASALLTGREREVIRLVSDGLSNRAIGLRLAITEGTVKRHVGKIFRKLEATSRTDAVRRAGLAGEL